MSQTARQSQGSLARSISLPAAVMLGLGSIMGTGVYVSLGLSAALVGTMLIAALAVGALLAACNGLSAAQLAAAHPQSGGTYEYGYKFLHPHAGFAAGVLFLLAKSASAATAALGVAGYLCATLGVEYRVWMGQVLGLVVVGAICWMTLKGIRRVVGVNTILVTVTLIGLATFMFVGGTAPKVPEQFTSFNGPSFLEASALMFVAYTGYGRIATLGEEVKSPRLTIPKAVVVTLVLCWSIYSAVGWTALNSVGSTQFSNLTRESLSPLQSIAVGLGSPLAPLIGLAAVTAMIGVVLNLILGLSRVALAMGRRGDLPASFGKLSIKTNQPRHAILFCSAIVAIILVVGDVKLTWSFSAFTVLSYYAITNLAALKLGPDQRLYPRWISYGGLIVCLALAIYVDRKVAMVGLLLLGLAFGLRKLFKK